MPGAPCVLNLQLLKTKNHHESGFSFQLVEAAGIEPASVSPLPQDTTCLA